ncbi:MAG: isocitrate/isopropylmalate dehydrogenase family protein [Planctomycetota bacterium]|jgi:3-isopropylmalate dehydrogenase|nr:isocitrate/isopropylmalate dehydrogenase family protein [Planctomycetota bacterium]
MTILDVATIPGDGIGPEVTAEAVKVVDTAAEKFGFAVKWTEFPFGAGYYLKHGRGLPESAFRDLADFKALLLGAVGDPRVGPGPLEREILLALRFHFDQYVNLRPALSFPGVPTPAPFPPGEALNAVIVRENTEDLYMGLGGSGEGSFRIELVADRGLYSLKGAVDLHFSPPVAAGFSIGLMSRPGIERIAGYAFALARRRGEKTVHAVSKANAVPHLYGFWDQCVRETAARDYPDLELKFVNVDAVCYLMARRPPGWGVVLCPNLFGDIVSDLMSALAGGIGLAAAGNIGEGLSMFEPVHGSAPDIAGTGGANPLAAILSAGMMLEHIGEKEASAAVENAVRAYLASDGGKPIELGGDAVTARVGDAVRRALLRS